MEVFFYGLFMDKELLKKKGLQISNPRQGYLDNYTLKIGDRASLISCKSAKAYGLLMTVKEEEVATLYAEKSLADYAPENVTIVTQTNEEVKATCYNLPQELLTGTNEHYAKNLHNLSKKLNFPNDYLNIIKKTE